MIEVATWAKAGATNPDVILALRKEAVTPGEVTRRVIAESGDEVTIIAAIEQGQIPAYDAAAVCATWPGEGWRFDAERFCWERSLPVQVLARLVRANAAHELVDDPGDERLGARMAIELMRQSPEEVGIDLLVGKAQPSPVEEDWAAALPGDLFEKAAVSAARAVNDPDDPFALWAHRWLAGETPFLHPQLEAV